MLTFLQLSQGVKTGDIYSFTLFSVIDRSTDDQDDESSTFKVNPDLAEKDQPPTSNPKFRHENEIQLQKNHQRSGSNPNDIQSTIYDMFNSRQKESGQNYHSSGSNNSHSGTADILQVKNAHFIFACYLLLLL